MNCALDASHFLPVWKHGSNTLSVCCSDNGFLAQYTLGCLRAFSHVMPQVCLLALVATSRFPEPLGCTAMILDLDCHIIFSWEEKGS